MLAFEVVENVVLGTRLGRGILGGMRTDDERRDTQMTWILNAFLFAYIHAHLRFFQLSNPSESNLK